MDVSRTGEAGWAYNISLQKGIAQTHTTRHFSKGVDFFSLRTPPSPLKAGTAARKNQSLLLMKSSLSSGLAQTYKLVSGASGRFQGIEAGIEA